MKIINIAISKQEILSEARLASAYAGARGGSPDDFDRVAASEADERLMERFWQESTARLVTALRPVLQQVTRSERGIILDLGLSDSASDSLCDEIETGCTAYLTAAVSARWFATVRREESAGADAFASAELDALSQRIFFRTSPRRRH